MVLTTPYRVEQCRVVVESSSPLDEKRGYAERTSAESDSKGRPRFVVLGVYLSSVLNEDLSRCDIVVDGAKMQSRAAILRFCGWRRAERDQSSHLLGVARLGSLQQWHGVLEDVFRCRQRDPVVAVGAKAI